MKEIEHVLSKTERVVWEGKPEFMPYYASKVIPGIFTPGILALLIILPFLWISYSLSQSTDGPFGRIFFFVALLFSSPFLLIAGWKLIGNPLYRFLEHGILYYAVTDIRVILQKGLIGRDFTSIDLDKIERMEVNVNTWDKIFRKGTGTITLFTTTLPYYLQNIPEPYDVFVKLQEMSQSRREKME